MATAAAAMISRMRSHSVDRIIAQCNCSNPHKNKIMIRDHTDYSRYFPSYITQSDKNWLMMWWESADCCEMILVTET